MTAQTVEPGTVTGTSFTVPAGTLRTLLQAGGACVGTGATVPALRVVQLEVTSEEIIVRTTDKFTAAVARTPVEFTPEPGTVLLLADDVRTWVKVLGTSRVDLARPATVTFHSEPGTPMAPRIVTLAVDHGATVSAPDQSHDFPRIDLLIRDREAREPIESVSVNPDRLARLGKLPHDKGKPVELVFTAPHVTDHGTVLRKPIRAYGEAGAVLWTFLLMPMRVTS